jgi:hypothetical protein
MDKVRFFFDHFLNLKAWDFLFIFIHTFVFMFLRSFVWLQMFLRR